MNKADALAAQKMTTSWTNSVVCELTKFLGTNIPSHLLEGDSKNGTEINLSDMFLILTHLRMEDGWTADYDYHCERIGAEPIVYSRNSSGKNDHLLNHVIADGSDRGWFQLALMAKMCNQFYRYWHACYGTLIPVATSADFRKLPSAVKSSLSAAKIRPTIESRPGGKIVVSLCLFSEHCGVSRVSMTMNRRFPYRLRDTWSECIVPYSSGIIY